MLNISQKKLKMLPVVVPPLDEQERFGEIVEATRATTRTADMAAETASALSRSLMSRLFQGEADAPVGTATDTPEPAHPRGTVDVPPTHPTASQP